MTVDSLSTLSASYSLSDTVPVAGINNLLQDPVFTDPGRYDFSLVSSSPAINAGDPSHAADSDGSRADIGGWFLSDSMSDLRNYRIAEGTTIPANGYAVFYEDTSFGDISSDPGETTAFALNENGETVYLYGPSNDLLLEYLEEETFEPSPKGASRGRYLKSTNTYNFVFMAEPSPGEINSSPLVGPIVISEIMYHPAVDGDAEHLELLNVSDRAVVLHDELKDTGWSVTAGVTYEFPKTNPITLSPGERLLLVRDIAAFSAQFDAPEGTQILQWTEGGLNNGGEGLELSRTGVVDELGQRQWVRIDRGNYGDDTLWPVEADGDGMSLTRADERAYGNDVTNWLAATPTPGTGATLTDPGFDTWATAQGLPANASKFEDDADHDGMTNGLEYATETNAMHIGRPLSPTFIVDGSNVSIAYQVPQLRNDIAYSLQQSADLVSGWQNVTTKMIPQQGGATVEAMARNDNAEQMFFRLRVQQKQKQKQKFNFHPWKRTSASPKRRYIARFARKGNHSTKNTASDSHSETQAATVRPSAKTLATTDRSAPSARLTETARKKMPRPMQKRMAARRNICKTRRCSPRSRYRK